MISSPVRRRMWQLVQRTIENIIVWFLMTQLVREAFSVLEEIGVQVLSVCVFVSWSCPCAVRVFWLVLCVCCMSHVLCSAPVLCLFVSKDWNKSCVCIPFSLQSEWRCWTRKCVNLNRVSSVHHVTSWCRPRVVRLKL